MQKFLTSQMPLHCVRIAQRVGLAPAAPAHYRCFVKRDDDPQAWAAGFVGSGVEPLLLPRNSTIFYPSAG